MTSNGIALQRKLPDLVRAGLTGINLSLDTLDPFKFEFMTRRRGHSAVLKALEVALDHLPPSGEAAVMGRHLSNVKLNVVVIRGVNDGEVADFAELARAKPVDVRFIEYMPFDGASSIRALSSSCESAVQTMPGPRASSCPPPTCSAPFG
jgi:cyclic pyranopterin phosphate synthase